jgi:hypothetical protein
MLQKMGRVEVIFTREFIHFLCLSSSLFLALWISLFCPSHQTASFGETLFADAPAPAIFLSRTARKAFFSRKNRSVIFCDEDSLPPCGLENKKGMGIRCLREESVGGTTTAAIWSESWGRQNESNPSFIGFGVPKSAATPNQFIPNQYQHLARRLSTPSYRNDHR